MFDFLSDLALNPQFNILGHIFSSSHEGSSLGDWGIIGNLGVGAIFYALYIKGDKERVAANNKLVTVLENTTPILTKVATVLEKVEQGMKKTVEQVETSEPIKGWQGDLEATLNEVKVLLERQK